MELKDTREQLTEQRRSHDSIIQAFESGFNSTSGIDEEQVEQMNQMHEQELKQLQSEFEAYRQQFNEENNALKDKISEQELNIKIINDDHLK